MIHIITEISAPAYLVRGGEAALERVTAILFEKGIERNNPDLFVRSFDALSVDDVRDVISFAHLKPLGEKKYIVIRAGSMTPEAENALLKVVEEGSGRSVFFFVVEPGVLVLPTLLSRCITVQLGVRSLELGAGEEFLKMGYQERMALAEKFTKDHDREGARELVHSLLSLADTQKFSQEALRDLLEADRFLALSGSSPKSVIGHLALVL